MTPEEEIEFKISIWSMRPQPNTPTGDAWEQGCRQGYEWGKEALQSENARLREALEKIAIEHEQWFPAERKMYQIAKAALSKPESGV